MTSRIGFLLTLVMTGVVGCQSYERQPLELGNHAADWVRRSIDIESIQQYAKTHGSAETDEAPFDSTNGLSCSEGEAVALFFNPRLRLARSRANVALASAEEAGWWPDPQFEAELLRFLDRGQRTGFRFDGPSLDGVNTGILGSNGTGIGGLELSQPGIRRVGGDFIDDPMIVGASLSFTIPISGRLAVEKDLRWSDYDAAWCQILVAEWELLTNLRDAWLEWSTLDERVGVSRDYVGRLEGIAKMVRQLADAGEMKPTEARVLRIELARQRTRIQAIEGQAEQKRLAILSLLGIAPDSPVRLHPQVFVSSVADASEVRRSQLLDNHPRIKAARARYETAEQRLRLEIRLQYPDLKVGPGFSFDEGFSRLGVGFGFPIPLWNRNRQGIAEALADREAARVAAEVEVELVFSELARVEASLDQASRQREYLVQEVAPLVDEQLLDTQTLLGLGEVDVLLLRDALSRSLETKLEVLGATLAEARASNRLAQMLRPRWFTPSQADSREDK